jgi:hypothetical protein
MVVCKIADERAPRSFPRKKASLERPFLFSKERNDMPLVNKSNNLLAGLFVLLFLLGQHHVACSCPVSYSVDCISWSEEGGTCQALHAIVRLRDDQNQPVIGANVEVTANRRISGGKKQGKYVRQTAVELSTNYQGEIDGFCDTTDPLPFAGTTAAFCWQQAVQAPYIITVVDIVWPACPNALWVQDPATDTSTYTFTGQACS